MPITRPSNCKASLAQGKGNFNPDVLNVLGQVCANLHAGTYYVMLADNWDLSSCRTRFRSVVQLDYDTSTSHLGYFDFFEVRQGYTAETLRVLRVEVVQIEI